ncbi:MAG: hypothetical protein MUD03_11380 [Pirellula sp.]|nr:hypothetical protein [Pirellula sp.]
MSIHCPNCKQVIVVTDEQTSTCVSPGMIPCNNCERQSPDNKPPRVAGRKILKNCLIVIVAASITIGIVSRVLRSIPGGRELRLVDLVSRVWSSSPDTKKDVDAPTPVSMELERFLNEGRFKDIGKVRELTNRVSDEVYYLRGGEAIKSLTSAFAISKKVLAESDDPGMTRAAWQLGQVAFDRHLRVCVDPQFFHNDENLVLMGKILEKLLKLGDRDKSYDSLREQIDEIEADLKEQRDEITTAFASSAVARTQQRPAYVNMEDWQQAIWVTQELIDVACRSPETVPIATSLVFVVEAMSSLEKEIEEKKIPPVIYGGVTKAYRIRKDVPPPPKPNPPKVWTLGVVNFFASKSETESIAQNLFPESHWNIRPGASMSRPRSKAIDSATAINGESITLRFEARDYEWDTYFLLDVEDYQAFEARLANYRIRQRDESARTVLIEVNSPKKQ